MMHIGVTGINHPRADMLYLVDDDYWKYLHKDGQFKNGVGSLEGWPGLFKDKSELIAAVRKMKEKQS